MALGLNVDSNHKKIITSLLNLAVFSYLLLILISNIHKVSGFSSLTKIICIIVFILLILWKQLSAFEYAAITAVVGIILWNSAIYLSSPFKIESTRFLMMAFCGIVIASGEFRAIFAKILVVSVISFFVYSIFILNLDPNEVLTSSRNGVSVNLLAYSSIVYLTDYIEGKVRPIIWPVLATLILSIIALGRSGIVISVLLFLIVVLINCRYFYISHLKKNAKSKLFVIVVMISFLMFIMIFLYFLLPPLVKWFYGSRFKADGMDSVRYELWKQFFSGLTLKSAILGYDLKELPLLVQYKLNLHNSFLGLWAKIGIAAFPVFIVTLLTAWNLRRKSYFLMIVFLLFLLRSSVDSVIYFKKNDFVLFAYMFVAFKNDKRDCGIFITAILTNRVNWFKKKIVNK